MFDDAPRLQTVTSLSGGKSSGYMWLHNPTDHCLFALVLTDDPATAPKDPGLLREVQERIPGFVGTTEIELTLRNVLRLEQKAQRPITWVCAYEGQSSPGYISDTGWSPKPLTFDRLVAPRGVLPDKTKRFCTEELKVLAIFWHIYLHIMERPDDMVWMHIGYRSDEGHRWAKLQNCKQNRIKFPYSCPIGAKDKRQKHNWREYEYRIPDVPMLHDGIDQLDVMKFWAEMGWQWPLVSNCAHCFFHDDDELNHNYEGQGQTVIDWAIALEESKGATFDSKRTLKQRVSTPNLELFPSREVACFCTD